MDGKSLFGMLTRVIRSFSEKALSCGVTAVGDIAGSPRGTGTEVECVKSDTGCSLGKGQK